MTVPLMPTGTEGRAGTCRNLAPAPFPPHSHLEVVLLAPITKILSYVSSPSTPDCLQPECVTSPPGRMSSTLWFPTAMLIDEFHILIIETEEKHFFSDSQRLTQVKSKLSCNQEKPRLAARQQAKSVVAFLKKSTST